MTILTIENLTASDLMVPSIGTLIHANDSVEMDWDQETIDIFREDHEELEALWNAGSMNLKINGMQLPEFHCIMITDCASVWNLTTKEYLEGVNAPDYMGGSWLLNPTPVEGVESRYWMYEDGALRAMTVAEIDIQEAPNMMEHKLLKINEIHENTLALNAQGFMFGNCHFSLNEMAQTNWDAIMTADNAGLLPYPIQVSQSNGTQYSIADVTTLKTFVGTALTIVNTNYASERVLISQAWAAGNKSTLDAIEDNR